ncbi:urease accessory protein UreD [Longirhabdus pacifica]|uniref:urease accessory protein UreD n=1 Tax=Longirhabdus pacifica TaxID=2305227 RepID=UPI0013E8D844|nr:urease accessory protein UreD [Longirhabdus pacifica]
MSSLNVEDMHQPAFHDQQARKQKQTQSLTSHTSKMYGHFTFKHGKTILQDKYHQGSLKISKTHRMNNHTPQLTVCMMDASPGMLEGDCYDLNFTLEEHTAVYLTNQSSTKIHPKHPDGMGCKLKQHITLKNHSCLEYVPEGTVPYAGSVLDATSTFHLEKGAALFLSDIVTPGRVYLGEQFDYESITTKLNVFLDHELIAWDTFHLVPQQHDVGGSSAFAHYTHVGSVWIFGHVASDTLLHMLRPHLPQCHEVMTGASLLHTYGLCIRILGKNTWQIQQVIRQVWNIWKLMQHEYPTSEIWK